MELNAERPVRGSDDRASLRRAARELRRIRWAAAEMLAKPLAAWEKFAPSVESMGHKAFVEWETIPLVDYLVHYLGDDDRNWRDLYIGERLKQLHWPEDTLEELIERRERVFASDREGLMTLLAGQGADVLTAVAARLDDARELVTTKARTTREVKILLVGDCLFLDISTFLAAPLLERGITLRPVFATSKNPIEMRNTLRGLAREKFDLVCYSPYSYESSLFLSQTHYVKGILSTPRALRDLAAEAHRQIAPTLRLLCEEFDCNVYLHNTANVRRHNHTAGSYLKNFATALARKVSAGEVNRLLMDELAQRNATAAKPLVLIDELKMVRRDGELKLGRKFYDSEPVHPTVMAQRLSEIYCDAIGAAKNLLTRKVVVADLDNTLWTGVIGEGAVVHDHRRQGVLKALKQKGVLLAIASKNDPRNVSWLGGLLREDDFVASQIHWEPKVLSVRRVAEELNLKAKDFVFIDDRPDEREMVGTGVPGIHCMDATSEATWRMLEWWAASLPEQNEADRTQMYQERKMRQTHLDEVAEKEDQQGVLAGLGLKVSIRPATQKELPRAVELINRTNQFNTRGSRVSTQQVTAWSGSPEHHILLAEGADKFGSMGIISVMVVEKTGDGLDIPVWVLSCRVFGFGFEDAMLNQVRRLGEKLGVEAIRAEVVDTPNNQPCRDVYAANGFTWTGSTWELRGVGVRKDPEWLSVTVAG